MIFKEILTYCYVKLSLHFPFILQTRGNIYQKKDEEETPLFVFVIAGVLLLSVCLLFLSIVKDFFVHFIFKIPAFTSAYRFNRHNLRFAYKIIGCHIVVADAGDRRGQYMYLISYLKRRFPLRETLDLSTIPNLHELYPESDKVFYWLKKRLDEEGKLQFIDYMVDLAFFNEKLSRREMRLIYRAGKIFGIPQNEVKSILTMRYKFYQDKRRREQEQRSKNREQNYRSNRKATHRSPTNIKKQSLKILGLNPSIKDFDTVKRAYRKMAKKHHPDRFHNEGKVEQQKAHERFTEINKAYEYLKNKLN